MSGSIIPAALAADALAAPISENVLKQTDPDFAAIEDYLLKVEMPKAGKMNVKTRAMVTLAALTTMTAETRLPQATADALKAGMSVVEIKETLYQCAPYIGITRVESALEEVNAALKTLGQNPTPASQSTVNEKTRFDKGLAVQKGIFGAAIDKMHATTPAELAYINKQALTAYSTPAAPVTGGQALIFDRTSTQIGSAISHADNSADIVISQPGNYVAIYNGTAYPQPNASLPETNLLTFTLNGTTLTGAATQHVFTTANETSAQSAAQAFTVTSVPATLQIVSTGGNFIYSNTALNVFKI